MRRAISGSRPRRSRARRGRCARSAPQLTFEEAFQDEVLQKDQVEPVGHRLIVDLAEAAQPQRGLLPAVALGVGDRAQESPRRRKCREPSQTPGAFHAPTWPQLRVQPQEDRGHQPAADLPLGEGPDAVVVVVSGPGGLEVADAQARRAFESIGQLHVLVGREPEGGIEPGMDAVEQRALQRDVAGVEMPEVHVLPVAQVGVAELLGPRSVHVAHQVVLREVVGPGRPAQDCPMGFRKAAVCRHVTSDQARGGQDVVADDQEQRRASRCDGRVASLAGAAVAPEGQNLEPEAPWPVGVEDLGGPVVRAVVGRDDLEGHVAGLGFVCLENARKQRGAIEGGHHHADRRSHEPSLALTLSRKPRATVARLDGAGAGGAASGVSLSSTCRTSSM